VPDVLRFRLQVYTQINLMNYLHVPTRIKTHAHQLIKLMQFSLLLLEYAITIFGLTIVVPFVGHA